jgi:hypothetical protein
MTVVTLFGHDFEALISYAKFGLNFLNFEKFNLSTKTHSCHPDRAKILGMSFSLQIVDNLEKQQNST